MQKDARTAETLGTLNVNRIHCACESGKAPLYDYQNCLVKNIVGACLLYTSPSPRDGLLSRMPSSA